MRDVLSVAAKILFYVLALVVIAWTASLTIELVSRLLPGDTITPFFALALFDGGALVWALVFLFMAQGLSQRAISLILMLLDLAGVIGMSIAELFLGGQQMAAIPQGLGQLVVWGVGLWTAINVIAVYAFHIVDPSQMTEIEVRSMQDRVQAEALSQVKASIHERSTVLAGVIARRIETDVLARMHLLDAPVIDAEARDVTGTSTGSVTDTNPTPARNARP